MIKEDVKEYKDIPEDKKAIIKEEEEDFDYDREKNKNKIDVQKKLTIAFEEDQRERLKLSKKIFWLTAIWSILIFVLLFFQGFGETKLCFFISDKVLITLITTTTINFFGFFYIVLKYMFKSIPSTKPISEKKPNKEIKNSNKKS